MNINRFLKKYTEKPDSAFKRLLVLISFGYLPVLIFNIILSYLEIIPTNFNNEKIFGFKAVLIQLAFSPLIILAFTVAIYLWLIFGHFVLKVLKTIFSN